MSFQKATFQCNMSDTSKVLSPEWYSEVFRSRNIYLAMAEYLHPSLRVECDGVSMVGDIQVMKKRGDVFFR